MGKVFFGILALLVIGGGIYFLSQQGKSTTQRAPEAISPTQTQPTTTQSEDQQQNLVTLTKNGFAPPTLTIKAGQTVTWINKSGEEATINSDPHPVHTAYPQLNLGSFSDGASLHLVFATPGTYGYHNHLNPSERGTIIVQ